MTQLKGLVFVALVFQRLHFLLHVVFAVALLALAEKVGLKELVLSFNLLVVFLHGFEALHELLNGEALQVDVGRVKLVRLVRHNILNKFQIQAEEYNWRVDTRWERMHL